MNDILSHMDSLTLDDIKSLVNEVKKDDTSQFDLYIPHAVSEVYGANYILDELTEHNKRQ